MKIKLRSFLLSGIFLQSVFSLGAATINVGGVANGTSTGYYLNNDGTFCTNGTVLFGSFNISQSALQSLIAGFQTNAPTYSSYLALLNDFTQVGTGGANGSSVSGWNFSTNGTIAGTSTGVDLTVFPQNTQMYAWSFNITNVGAGITNNASSFTTGTQWGLFTAGSNSATAWGIPSTGTKSLVLNQVSTSGTGAYLIGSAASSNPNIGNFSVKMVVQTVPEPTTTGYAALAFVASLLVIFIRRKNESRTLNQGDQSATI
jgi:hypothetical protein